MEPNVDRIPPPDTGPVTRFCRAPSEERSRPAPSSNLFAGGWWVRRLWRRSSEFRVGPWGRPPVDRRPRGAERAWWRSVIVLAAWQGRPYVCLTRRPWPLGDHISQSADEKVTSGRSLTKGSLVYYCRDLWVNGVVPFAVELFASDVDGVDFGVGDFELGLVGVGVQAGVDLQAGAGRGRGD